MKTMKKLLIIPILALLGISQLTAQDYEYVPFVREGVKWVYSFHDENDDSGQFRLLNLELKGDTVINGKTYKAMHKYYGDAINEENDTIPVFLREDDKVVYGIVPDGRKYSDCPLGCTYNSVDFYDGQEHVLYDFGATEAFWNNLLNVFDQETVDFYSPVKTDTIMIGTHMAKRHEGLFMGNVFFTIEGIGMDTQVNGYPLFFFKGKMGFSSNLFHLSHVIEDGEIIYKSVNYEEPQPADDYGYVPYITEGVKFINEKVIVNNGDTTSYYYTYEMTPDVIVTYDEDLDTLFYDDVMWCHYYTGQGIDESNDSIICGIYLIHPGFFNAFNNKAFKKIKDEGRNLIILPGMMDGAFRELYDPLYSYNSFAVWAEVFYIDYQPNNYLNNDNFYEVEPTVVDGRQMQRFAHINDQGDILAYIVQGIGFDSYDMGDLLTPFTRKPDPDADHQEWCGLSHVVKDGKVIYKGMRYRHGAFTGINETMADRTRRNLDPQYYNLMGQPVGKDVPTVPGIYIHQGRKICVSRTP